MAAQVETTHQGSGGGGGGDVSVTAGDPSQSQNRTDNVDDDDVVTSIDDVDEIEKTRTLICALNFLSRNLPLPPDVYDAVSTIYQDGSSDADVDCDSDSEVAGGFCNPIDGSNVVGGGGVGSAAPSSEKSKDGSGISSYGDLMADFEVALFKQRQSCMSGNGLAELKETRYQSQIQHRLSELEELPTNRGEDLQSKCLLELYGLKLADLQAKVRSEVSAEYWLRLYCSNPEKQLFDWGMMRLPRPLYGIGDAFAVDPEDPLKKKRDAERLSRLEEEERNRVETKKRKFFTDLLNAARELQLQVQAAQKRRKQRNDGVQAWHGRQRQRATRAEKLRFQALKADDQEAYMKMVEESKNERLTMLLGKTNDLLVRLGAAVQRQKDAEHDGIGPSEGSDADLPEVSASKAETPGQSLPEEDEDNFDNEPNRQVKTGDLLEGQRQYNSVVHSIQEKVTEQPAMLEGGVLRPYQLEGLQWMLSLFNNNLNGILADEMGLGKTIQTISLIAYLMENKGVAGPHLVVAPKAVLPNWKHEFTTWAPSMVAVLYDGRLEERKAMREEYSGEGKFNVLITHYDLIIRDKAFLKKIHWYYMIVDEGHRLKNHDCVLARTLVSGYRIRRRLLLTGTPIQNSLQELWSLLNFLLPTIFNSVENFEEWFNAPFADKGDAALTDEEELLIIRRLHQVIRPFILRRKKDEVEKYLPAKTQVILKCDMSAWQKVYYHQVTDVGRVGLHNRTGKSQSLNNLSMQLRKCCNHPYLFVGDYNMWRRDEIVRASGKFELLDRLLPKLRRAGHRILLFSQMTRLIDILEIYLQLHDFKYLRLDGSTKTEERGTLLKQFNAPDSPYFIFLLSTRAGGLGLNLQSADTVIIFDSDWNPQMDQQAEDRAHRIGQKKEVRVFVLVSVGSIEEVILERAKQKMGIDAKVIQAGLFNTTSTVKDREELLEEIMRRGSSSLGTDVPSEREINRLAARTEEEFWLFEKIDEERRKKESYRTRLMEEQEVPDWVYATPDPNDKKGKGFDYEAANITGKRRRKEVIYQDTYNDELIKELEHTPLIHPTAMASSTSSSLFCSSKLDFPVSYSDRLRRNLSSSLAFSSRTHKFSDKILISRRPFHHSLPKSLRSILSSLVDVNSSVDDAAKVNAPKIEVKTGTWNWKGYSIRYQYAGSSGPALVLVHGFGANSDHWRKNIPVLGQSHQVFAIDLIGYGYSDKPNPRELQVDSFYTFETWGSQLNDFCTSVVQDEAFFICNSIGGLVGLQAAITMPENCKGIVLLNISLRMLHIKKQLWYARPLIRSFQNLLRNTPLGKFFFRSVATPESVKNILCQCYHDISQVTDELVEAILRPGLQPGAADVFLEFICYSGGPLPEDLIPQVKCPVLVVWGDKDPWEPIELGRAYGKFQTVENFVVLPDVGHCPQDEAPHLVNPIVESFVARHSSTTTDALPGGLS